MEKVQSKLILFRTVVLKILLIGLVAIPIQAQEQNKKFLLLKRGANQKTQIRFYPGENITYKSKKIGYFVTDKIVDLDMEYLYLSDDILKPSDIISIDVRGIDSRNRLVNVLKFASLGAGSMLLAAEGVNSIYQRGQLKISNGVAKTSSILLGMGLGLLPVRYKTFTLSDKNKVQLVLLEIE
ncbi:MAG: hypothetical protein O2829_04010 [Bacteroidetes bacterium]|nr:hypothetical protein [Bacteroidota bacterium]MDA1268238.1 hypothetical protein [Bacteroidota bacterium]